MAFTKNMVAKCVRAWHIDSLFVKYSSWIKENLPKVRPLSVTLPLFGRQGGYASAAHLPGGYFFDASPTNQTTVPDFPTPSSPFSCRLCLRRPILPQIAPLVNDPRFDKGAMSRLGLVSPSLLMYLSTMDAALRASSEGCFDVVVRYEELVERQLDLLHHLVVKLFPERAQQLDNPVRTVHPRARPFTPPPFPPRHAILTTSSCTTCRLPDIERPQSNVRNV